MEDKGELIQAIKDIIKNTKKEQIFYINDTMGLGLHKAFFSWKNVIKPLMKFKKSDGELLTTIFNTTKQFYPELKSIVSFGMSLDK